MKEYIERRLPDVRAVQWFKHGDVPGLAVDLEEPNCAILDLNSRWGKELLRPGDYYIEHRGGAIYRMSKEEFENIYMEFKE